MTTHKPSKARDLTKHIREGVSFPRDFADLDTGLQYRAMPEASVCRDIEVDPRVRPLDVPTPRRAQGEEVRPLSPTANVQVGLTSRKRTPGTRSKSGDRRLRNLVALVYLRSGFAHTEVTDELMAEVAVEACVSFADLTQAMARARLESSSAADWRRGPGATSCKAAVEWEFRLQNTLRGARRAGYRPKVTP